MLTQTAKMLLVLVSILGIASAQNFGWDDVTELDQYVHSDDGFYSYEIVTDFRVGNFCTMYIVNMTSQKWMDETFVDRPIWTHWMGVAVPDSDNFTHPDVGFLFISGSDNGDPYKDPDDAHSTVICGAAVDMGTVGAYINQMPNQPLVFYNDPTLKSRREDGIIAWTWRTFFDDPSPTPDPTVICRYPMTKAAKRAMDCVNDVAIEVGASAGVDRFIVTGPSKRGWTAWSIAATDQRVIATAPLVFSMLKVNETLMVHYQAMGGAWSFAFAPYYNEDLTKELLDPKAIDAMYHEDMWYYRERLTLPILQIVSTGDEFFLLQDSHQWWDEIPDPKWTLMLQNAEHVMFPHYLRIYETIVSWGICILEGIDLPEVRWTRADETDAGKVTMSTDTPPQQGVIAYTATTLVNDTRRDFRLASGNDTIGVEFHPVIWEEAIVNDLGDGRYESTVPQVADEWVGLVLQGTWNGPKYDYRMIFSTETHVTPDTFPVGECTDSESCYGTLV